MITTLQPLLTLTLHPAVEHLPMLAEDSPGARALLESVREIGILEPLKTCGGKVVDGRHRLRAARAVGLAEVPCDELGEEAVHSIILGTLVARKHYSKSALAYLAFPHVEPMMKEAKTRHLEFLKHGGKEQRASGAIRSATSTEEIAEALGVCRRDLFSARNIHGHFRKNAELRKRFEPLILSGQMGLGAVLQGIVAFGQPKRRKTANEPLQQWEKKIRGLTSGQVFAGWDKASPEVKDFVRAKILKALQTWPPELAELVRGKLGEN